LKRLERRKKLKTKQRPSNKSFSIDLRRWRRRWLLVLKLSRLPNSKRNNSKRPKSNWKKKRMHRRN